jgi:dipeptidyl aminopeptidase/acylaminoacyl peptidase
MQISKLNPLRPKFAVVLLLALLLQGEANTAVASQTTSHNAQPDTGAITISHLRNRSYGGDGIVVERTLVVTAAFTRTLISYTSDGLKQYGFMNMPKGAGPFPVVLVLHGYVNPRAYRTPITYTARDADALARAGFLVIHPDYRGHGRSADGPNLFRTGYAIDVLNLIAQVKQLPQAKAGVGIWGHSMGGGIAQRVLVVNRTDVRAAVLYGAMNADEALNVDRIKNVFRPGSVLPEEDVPKAEWSKISPVNYLADITAAVQIHHGTNDRDVPVAWSDDLAQRLDELGKDVDYFKYDKQPHILQGASYTQFVNRVVAFYRARLK